jgi:OOP family OmpA-OmpF porin
MPVKLTTKACANLCMCAFATLTTPVLAQSWDGQTYVTVQGGWNQQEDHNFTTGGGAKVNTEMKDGYVVVGAVGRQYGNIRAELEGSYRANDVDGHNVGGPVLEGSRGESKVMAGMGNLYYDIPTGGALTPYLGGGVGAADVQFENYGTNATGTVLDDGETVFAYQGIAGLNYALTGNVSLNAEYRYFATADVEVQSGTRTSDVEYRTHNVIGGVRYIF